jgi:hypothetical protein
MQTKNNSGFLLISLVIALAIIAILFSLYFKKNDSEQASQMERGQQGIEDAKQNKELLIEQNLEIQNQINSINP